MLEIAQLAVAIGEIPQAGTSGRNRLAQHIADRGYQPADPDVPEISRLAPWADAGAKQSLANIYIAQPGDENSAGFEQECLTSGEKRNQDCPLDARLNAPRTA